MKSKLKEEFFAHGKVKDCPVYDMHGHMGPFSGGHLPGCGLESMINTMDRVGIKLLVFSHHASLSSPDIGNDLNIATAQQHPDKLRAYCAVNPHYPEIIKKDLESFEKYKKIYVGFKFHADSHEYPITGKNYELAWKYADKNKLLVLLHTWGKSPYNGPEPIKKVAEKYKNVKILLGHSCHDEWDKAVLLAKKYPNIYLELCAVMDNRGVLDKFVKELGSQKILFGTDFPWFSHYYYIGAVLGADITDEDRRNIFYKNAKKLIK